ncbi:MAG: chromate transporter [Blastocatellia bacterium]|nr:chromate transporter [Blastocatellia bacterium]
MIPPIPQEVVKNAHWLTHQQFVDGMALGQMTSMCPVLITAIFCWLLCSRHF